MLKRSCDACQKWMYDDETGQVREHPPGSGVPLPRPATSPTPCDVCPKCAWSREKSPRVGRRATLSAKNRKTIEIYHQTQIAAGRLLSPRALEDGVLMRNLGIVAELLDDHRRESRARIERLAIRLLRSHSR